MIGKLQPGLHGCLFAWLLLAGTSSAGSLSENQFEALWSSLATSDPAKAEQAISALVAEPGPTIAFLHKRLRAVPQVTAQQLEKWIADLNSDRFRVREEASQELQELGESCEPVLRRTLRKGASPEVRRRIECLLDKFKRDRLYPPPERCRMSRAVEVLERIGDPEACKLLDTLSTGAPDDPFTIDVVGAQARLKKRVPSR